jgi:hypothetical protein
MYSSSREFRVDQKLILIIIREIEKTGLKINAEQLDFDFGSKPNCIWQKL